MRLPSDHNDKIHLNSVFSRIKRLTDDFSEERVREISMNEFEKPGERRMMVRLVENEVIDVYRYPQQNEGKYLFDIVNLGDIVDTAAKTVRYRSQFHAKILPQQGDHLPRHLSYENGLISYGKRSFRLCKFERKQLFETVYKNGSATYSKLSKKTGLERKQIDEVFYCIRKKLRLLDNRCLRKTADKNGWELEP